MGKVGTDKKLELIRTIRMQNQYNRQLFKSRENLIYAEDPSMRHGEIYGLETMTYPLKEEAARTNERAGEGSGMLRSFRLRFLIAMGLFLAFVYCDIRKIQIGSVTSGQLYQIINENEMIPELLNWIK